MPSNKMLSTLMVGKLKGILKETEENNKEVIKNTSLENPIMSDVVMSNKAHAYDKILNEYKLYVKKKKSLQEDE